jgi:hypothetical protein
MLGITQDIIFNPAAWGAFLTGLGSVGAVLLSLRKQKQRSDDLCEKRIDEIRKAFRVGTQFEKRQEQKRRAG